MTVSENKKGILDVDTVKGCTLGLYNYPVNGCYNACYAAKIARCYGFDFTKSVSRRINPKTFSRVFNFVKKHRFSWYRVGTYGDPCHDWINTIEVCEALKKTDKVPVIVTKHWIKLTDSQISKFKKLRAIFNTSASGLDSVPEMVFRIKQFLRLREAGIKSICRVVTCNFGSSNWARVRNKRQKFLLTFTPVIDTPLRISNNDVRVKKGDIKLNKIIDSIGGWGRCISLHSNDIYLGKCDECPEMCGINC